MLVLGACDAGTNSGGLLKDLTQPKPAPKQISVAGNDVMISGPAGFCIDPTETKAQAKPAFVLLGSCQAISGSPLQARPNVPAILVATVSAKTKGAAIATAGPTLRKFFNSDAGRKALSRDGNPKTVTVLEMLVQNNVFYIHARDSSKNTLAGAGQEYWRALFNVNGRIVSASAVGLLDQPISSGAGFNTLKAFVNRIVTENAPNSASKPAKSFFEQLFKKQPI